MKENSVLIKERMAVGAHIIDIRRNNTSFTRQSIMLIHGIGVSSRYFIPFAERLAQHYHVIAIDLPGYGQAPKPARPLSVAELADVVVQLTRQLQLDQPVLIGQSMGCQIAARAVRKAPSQYKKMILLAPTVNVKERSLPIQAVRLFQDTLREPLALNMIILADYARMGFRRYVQTSQYMLCDYIEESLPECMIPTLIVRGEKDRIVPDDWVHFLQSVTPNSKLVEIPNGPHVVQYKMAAPLAGICRRFISEN